MTKITKRSFVPANAKPAPILHFRGEGAKYIGFEEPTWPSFEEQSKWSKDEYDRQFLLACAWYASTQDDEHGHTLAMKALSAANNIPELVLAFKKAKIQIPHTAAWVIRMIHLGLKIRFKESKFVVRELRKCIELAQTKLSEIEVATAPKLKPNIQDFIDAKLRRVKGEIDSAYDKFILSGYQTTERTIMCILADPATTAPGNRTKDLIEYASRYLTEYKLALSGKDEQLNEAYAHLGKKELKAAIAWWETAIADITSFGIVKKSVRKTRKKKMSTPDKVVSKLRFLRMHPEMHLTSIDPVQILKSTNLWVINTKTRKIGKYVALPNTTLDVKGNKILNVDPAKSTQKTLRKIAEQLKQFNGMSKAGAFKWFDGIKAVETSLRESMNADTILLKAIK